MSNSNHDGLSSVDSELIHSQDHFAALILSAVQSLHTSTTTPRKSHHQVRVEDMRLILQSRVQSVLNRMKHRTRLRASLRHQSRNVVSG